MYQIMDEKQETILSLKSMLHLVLMLATLCEWHTTLGSQEASEVKLAFENPNFISIDCGAPHDYDDKGLRISFKSDKDFIDTGVNANISKELLKKYRNHGQDLRYFPKGTRNCYTLNPRAGRENKYLIRASFLYGNYDGKNRFPSFDLYLANDKWTTVDKQDPSYYQYYEIIYVPSSDYVDVCLHNTGSGIPFISALELRPLDNNIYDTTAGWLFIQNRENIGASTSVRYPDDIYDRIWVSGDFHIINSGWQFIDSSSIGDKINSNDYKLPVKVSSAAAKSENATTPLVLSYSIANATAQYAFYFHFAEIQTIQEGQKRKLNIYLNNFLLDTVEFDYLDTWTYIYSRPTIRGKNTLSISNADNSSLPPFLNAVEVFKLITIKGLSSAPDDVNAVKGIKKKYSLTIDTWQGDPCTPKDFLWEGLNCSYNDVPRVISVNLRWSNLKGEIDPLFGTLSALESLDLSHNELSGQIPDVLADLPKLVNLNLTGNNLSGPIPKALQDKSRRGSLQLSLDENPNACQSNLCPMTATEEKNKTSKSFIVPVVASTASVLVLLLFISAAIFWRKRRRNQEVPTALQPRREPLISKEEHFSYSEVVSITNNFTTLIGEGGFGKVYHGILNKETQVAVKMLSPLSNQGYKEFQAEANNLLKVNHKNLVTLIGYCDEDDHKGFIYEYMAKGNLRQVLSDTNPTPPNWRQRLQIAVDSAQGVHYLHNGSKETIIHRDLKTSNILLDENLRAKVADFGLSKAFKSEIETSVGSTSAGTPGYSDPEYHKAGNLSTKSDVYSFGVVLLEIITGRSAIMREASKNINIVDWTRNNFNGSSDIKHIVDKRLEGEFDQRSARKAIDVAMSCVGSTAEERPDMSRVLEDLNACLNMEMKVTERTSMELGDNATGLVETRSPNT